MCPYTACSFGIRQQIFVTTFAGMNRSYIVYLEYGGKLNMICFVVLEIYRGYLHIFAAQKMMKILKINLLPPFSRQSMYRIS